MQMKLYNPHDINVDTMAGQSEDFDTHCSKNQSNKQKISQNFFHFPMLIGDGDCVNMQKKLRFHGGFFKKFKFWAYWKIFLAFYISNMNKRIEFIKIWAKYDRIFIILKKLVQ